MIREGTRGCQGKDMPGILCVGCHDADVQSFVGSQYLVRCTAPTCLSTIESDQDKGMVQRRLPCTP